MQKNDVLFKIRVTNFIFTTLLLLGLLVGGRYLEAPVSGNLSSGEMGVILSTITLLAYIRLKVNFKIAEIKKETNDNATKTTERNLSFLRLVLGVLAMSLLAFLFIYNSEIPSAASYFFTVQFPQITDKVIDVATNVFTSTFSLITGIIGNLILNVIGSFIYDLLKKYFLKEKGN